nr:josephin-like protein [Ipomoea trifida]GMC79104.1 josephin-like protein [Ipomoea batatas]GME15425.1 josephin-like protein [Ipomoea batatas]
MSRKMSKRVSFSPEGYHEKPETNLNRTKKVSQESSSEFSPVRFLKHIGANMARLVSSSDRKRSSRKVSSSASLGRSRSYAERSIDSQRAEAIEDCIEFLNSSSSLHRSSSVSSSCCS